MATLRYAFDDQPFGAFRSQHIRVKVATESWEKQAYFSLRRQVFAREQKLLPDNEQDGQDFSAIPIVALAGNCGMNDSVVGAVRIYRQHSDYRQDNDHRQPSAHQEPHEEGDNLWYGGRLCVARDYRGHASIGKALINEAVSRAIDLGCTRFLANVQQQNESYFHSVHWRTLGTVIIADRPHVHMEAMLPRYPFMVRDCLS